jgi:hypothetical protein
VLVAQGDQAFELAHAPQSHATPTIPPGRGHADTAIVNPRNATSARPSTTTAFARSADANVATSRGS